MSQQSVTDRLGTVGQSKVNISPTPYHLYILFLSFWTCTNLCTKFVKKSTVQSIRTRVKDKKT